MQLWRSCGNTLRWLISFWLDANARRCRHVIAVRGRFEKEHADIIEQCKREAVPVSFPTGEAFNLTVQGRVARNPKLAALAAK
jgi:hypothetical protein